MTDKFLAKLQLIAGKRGYEVYYPCAGLFDNDTALGVAVGHAPHEFMLLIETYDTNMVEAVIKALPKVKQNA